MPRLRRDGRTAAVISKVGGTSPLMISGETEAIASKQTVSRHCWAVIQDNIFLRKRNAAAVNNRKPLARDSRPNRFSAALRTQAPFRPWASASQGGGMCSDSESAGGSSESRSMDSPTASPGEATRSCCVVPSPQQDHGGDFFSRCYATPGCITADCCQWPAAEQTFFSSELDVRPNLRLQGALSPRRRFRNVHTSRKRFKW